ncbi:MAG: hypothetical protein LUG93_05135 [Lachnospiraceae bacterium]|nr:hypothetical protein [Lachnospiraceae bacterium]
MAGSYDVDVPGEYELSIYAVDSSGYSSNVETLLLVVEEAETEKETETETETEAETESGTEEEAGQTA